MSTAVQRRRGTTLEHLTFVGLEGETTYDVTLKRLVANDGATPGGFPAAMLHVANIFSQPQTISLAPAALSNAFDIQVSSISRLNVRNDGFGFFTRQEADNSLSGISLDKRGAVGDANAALVAGGGLGMVQFRGWDGAAFGSGGSVRMFTSEAWTGIAHGTKLFFQTVPIGSVTPTTHATLNSTEFEVMSRLLLPNTTSATVGGIYFGGVTAVHNFGSANFFAGVGAGNLTMTGAYNSFFGATSGASNAAGAYNSFFGQGSGRFNTDGIHNSFFGSNAGDSTNTGNRNSFFGSGAGFYNTTGANNSFFGFHSGYSNVSGLNNVFFGYAAGLFSTGSNNIMVGTRAGDNLTAGNNNLFIGFDINAPSATGSNQMSIGNLIFGTGIDGTGTTISSGNIGIAVVTPTSGLHLGRSFAAPYRATAVTTTFLATDYTINATSGTFTLNLPTSVGITGRIYVAKNSGVGTITLDPDGAELIDGLATATIVSGAALMVQSSGTGWIII